MTAPIDDVSALPGRKLTDQTDNPVGKVQAIYAMDDGYPMWVAVAMTTGLIGRRTVVVPLARLKDEGGQLKVPYSKKRIGESPSVDDGDGISAECDRTLRDYYGIDAGDQEMRTDNKSYATAVSENGGTAARVDDPTQLETPDPDTRTEETAERLNNPGSSETREVTAADVTHDDQDVEDAD